jgi:hypothetical protein
MITKDLIIVGYARAGLTILNRYFAGDSRIVCLSEVNSKHLCPTLPNEPYVQLKEWYGASINSGNFHNQISEISRYCKNQDKRLMIRDWSFGSFVPLRYNDFSPSKTLNTVDDLKSCLSSFETVCIVRNPVDIWLSMKFSKKTFHDKELEYLLQFTKDVLNRGLIILKYEDFVTNPKIFLEKLYRLIDMESPENILLSNQVIGDSNYPESSRGAHLNRVEKLSQRPLSEEDCLFLRNQTRANEISKILGYPEI